MISVDIDTAAAAGRLQRGAKALRARLRESFTGAAQALLEIVRAKLSGPVLRAGSGALRASLRAEVTETTDGLGARVWSDGSLPYARIQEYGGRVAVPGVVPRNAGALAFVYGGKLVFAKHAAAHTIELPERSYMRTSLAEFAPVFLDRIRRIDVDHAP